MGFRFIELFRLINYYCKRKEEGLPINIDGLNEKHWSEDTKNAIKKAVEKTGVGKTQ